jgi:hypothetical protein
MVADMTLNLKKLPWILIPALLAGRAVAQVQRLPGGINPYIGAPISLPGPYTSPAAGLKIELPAPALHPGALALKTVSAPAVAISMPGPLPALPFVAITAERENVRHPLAAVFPDLKVQLSKPEKKGGDAVKEKLDEKFDGRFRKDLPAVELPEDLPRPARRIGLPEWDLENELGLPR